MLNAQCSTLKSHLLNQYHFLYDKLRSRARLFQSVNCKDMPFAPTPTSSTLTCMARRAWLDCDGSGMIERGPCVSATRFAQAVASQFGVVKPVSATPRTFDFACAHMVARIHTDGRKPSSHTVRVLRAASAVFSRVYGPMPGARVWPQALQIYLCDGTTPKQFPAKQPVTVSDINSGFSVVFRASEMHRTIVHELVHAWRAHGDNHALAQVFARTRLGAPRACLLTESYVEAVTYLVYGGMCASSLDLGHCLRNASACLRVHDDGSTNIWAYFVGKALLVADGGCAFSSRFFPRGKARKLVTVEDHMDLVAIMDRACSALGGPSLPLAPRTRVRTTPVTLCPCDIGPPFE